MVAIRHVRNRRKQTIYNQNWAKLIEFLYPSLKKLGENIRLFSKLVFCRVLPELNISNLRTEIEAQLDNQEFPVPQEYIFIRNVGRHFAMVSLLEEETNTGFSYVPPIFANSLIIMCFPLLT